MSTLPISTPPQVASLASAAAPKVLLHPAFVRLLFVQSALGLSFSVFLILPKHLTVGLGAGPFEIGWIMALYGAANILLAKPLARLLRRVGRRRFMRLGALCTALGGAVFMFVDHAGLLAGFGRFVQGIAWAMIFTAGSALAADLAPPGRMAQAMGVFASAVLAMNAVGPPLAEPLLAEGGPIVVFGIAVAAALLAFVLAGRLPADGPTRETAQVTPAAGRVLPVQLWALWAVLGFSCATMFSFHQPLALQRGVLRVSDFLLGYTVTALAVRVVAGRWLDRVGYERACRASLALYGVVVAGTQLMAPGTIAVLGAVFGIAHGTFYPSFMALSLARVSADERPLLMTTVNVAFSAGSLLVVALGFVAERVGLPLVFSGVGAVTLAGLWCLRRRG